MKFQGIAASYGTLIQGDMLAPGAFSNSIAKMNGKPFPLIYQHNNMMIPGGAFLKETDAGLMLDEASTLDTPLGEEVAQLIKAELLRSLSVGFTVSEKNAELKKTDKGVVLYIHEARLLEVSVVLWPADPSSLITNIYADQKAVAIPPDLPENHQPQQSTFDKNARAEFAELCLAMARESSDNPSRSLKLVENAAAILSGKKIIHAQIF